MTIATPTRIRLARTLGQLAEIRKQAKGNLKNTDVLMANLWLQNWNAAGAPVWRVYFPPRGVK